MGNENANPVSPEPNHDSSELAKHLRTVHFTLLTVCILLAVVATADPKSEVQTALGQGKLLQVLNGTAAVTNDDGVHYLSWKQVRPLESGSMLDG